MEILLKRGFGCSVRQVARGRSGSNLIAKTEAGLRFLGVRRYTWKKDGGRRGWRQVVSSSYRGLVLFGGQTRSHSDTKEPKQGLTMRRQERIRSRVRGK